ncbi:putative polysaccharide biosynthesis protein [Sulfobacillus thermosulfidooxidans]|uniref:putative polysaccharide biosynthesis protein n=1 Tax=Sulfobacillus thermosulfidooxidans TaxID=28034 RepID=UPI00096BB732|nr:polysaccharide biosynthesis protein [Sulfobacillus thermosulfidooxidans]OLZ09233.1 polysaccharide biosynthesis protein [Sulfobacillus thermosulfidooxidans]OLZ17798.1 polysaccharide biosynthesis protein [Sulfobacillus thermosulfidooxidans]OLZ22344.1 polysaccharide biosynthesis protein [Sulfobacillus thermosulfidooxidans]
MKKSTLWRGAFWLSLGALISKSIGAIYRIFLPRILGDYGVGLFQMAYPLYALLLAVSVNGIPTALSKETAEKLSHHDIKSAEQLAAWAQIFLSGIGLVMAVMLEFLAPWVARYVFHEPEATLSIRALAPALAFVASEASLRGYFQGYQEMAPTAISQILEQVSRVAVMFPLALMWLPKGTAWAAAGATVGAPVGAMIGMLFLLGARLKRRRWVLYRPIPWAQLRQLFLVAMPMSLSGLLFPLMFLADSMFVPEQLVKTGLSLRQATAQFGRLSGEAMPLINLTMVVGAALAVSLVPAIAQAMAENDRQLAAKRVNLAVHMIWLLGLPMAGGLIVLAKPLTRLLYGESGAMRALQVLAVGSAILAIQQVLGSSLQASGHGWIPVKNLLFGAFAKFVLTWWLTPLPSLGIRGAAIGTVGASVVTAWLNWKDWSNIVHPLESPWKDAMWPFVGTIVMVMGIQTWMRFCHIPGIIGPVVSAIVVGIAIYFVLMAALGELNVLKALRE